MSRPRIFISSTFYDLRQTRSDLDRFIDEMGYEPVRNETGKIPYGKEEKLEDYCYKEISDVDILVGIIGGKFGSSSEKNNLYSITQNEIKAAIEQNKQIYLFIDKNVLSEYQTYLLNKENENVKYRFVDNIKIYIFIEEIFSLPKNNTVHPFETAEEIISFLKEQWAGLFRDLLVQNSEKALYGNVASKVTELTEVTTTLKTYLEEVLESVTKEKGKAYELIQKEKERLESAHAMQRLKELPYAKHSEKTHNIQVEELIKALQHSKTPEEFRKYLIAANIKGLRNPFFTCLKNPIQMKNINQIRELLNLKPFEIPIKVSKGN